MFCLNGILQYKTVPWFRFRNYTLSCSQCAACIPLSLHGTVHVWTYAAFQEVKNTMMGWDVSAGKKGVGFRVSEKLWWCYIGRIGLFYPIYLYQSMKNICWYRHKTFVFNPRSMGCLCVSDATCKYLLISGEAQRYVNTSRKCAWTTVTRLAVAENRGKCNTFGPERSK
jgi:hypothetical protein